MKKWLMMILSLAFAICCCLGLAACELFGLGTGGGNSSSGGSSSGSVSGSSDGSTQSQEDSDGTFIYSGTSIKAATTSISGEITIPTERNGVSIDTIPADAFKGCNAITSITVPESVTEIGAGAFNGCSSLRSITLPFVGSQKGNGGTKAACFGYIFGTSSYQGGMKILQYVREGYGTSDSDFYYIPLTLRFVTITNEIVIGYGAFQNCSILSTIVLNDEIIQVGQCGFQNCSKIEEINLPNISIIPASLFSGCISLSKFIINSSIDTIGKEAFEGCSALSSLNSEAAGTFIIPNTVISIGSAAFNGCSLIKSITLPFVGGQKGNSDKSSACFGYIFGTKSYQGGISVEQIYGAGINMSQNFKIPSSLRSVIITNETIIARGAFQNCSMLQSITINKAAQSSVGEKAFDNTAEPTWN